jgi:hypothetical protein
MFLRQLDLIYIPPAGLGRDAWWVAARAWLEVAAPGLAPLRQIGGFICLVSLTLVAVMHMLLRTYYGTIWRAFWFGNRSNILPALYFGGATRAPPFFRLITARPEAADKISRVPSIAPSCRPLIFSVESAHSRFA